MTRSASIGLFGSIGAALIVIIFYYASPYRFYISNNAANYLFYGGVALAVLVIAMALMTVRKKPRQIRTIDDINERITNYAAMVRSLYSTTFATNVILSVIILLCHNNALLMFVIITVLLQFMTYPNMYKVKVDAGLTHEQMHEIYGDAYSEPTEDNE